MIRMRIRVRCLSLDSLTYLNLSPFPAHFQPVESAHDEPNGHGKIQDGQI